MNVKVNKERGHSTTEYAVCLLGILGLIVLLIFPQVGMLVKDFIMERMCEPLVKYADWAIRHRERLDLGWMPRTFR